MVLVEGEMPADWYYRTMGETHGPFTSIQFRQLAQERAISPLTDVRRGVDGDWVSAQRVQGLFDNVASTETSRDSQWVDAFDDVSSDEEYVQPEVLPVYATPAAPPKQNPNWHGKYEYMMEQIPQVIEISSGSSHAGRAAAYLQSVVDSYAKRGWEFYRVDEIGVRRNAGCLGALFGMSGETVLYYVVTFRRLSE
jgi:hypothetical protein